LSGHVPLSLKSPGRFTDCGGARSAGRGLSMGDSEIIRVRGARRLLRVDRGKPALRGICLGDAPPGHNQLSGPHPPTKAHHAHAQIEHTRCCKLSHVCALPYASAYAHTRIPISHPHPSLLPARRAEECTAHIAEELISALREEIQSARGPRKGLLIPRVRCETHPVGCAHCRHTHRPGGQWWSTPQGRDLGP